MFRELRLQYGLTQSEIAEATHRTPNYILKAEDLTFPEPAPALLQFYRELDPALTVDLMTSAYHDAQRKQRRKWLDWYLPAPAPQASFRLSWFTADDEADVPTQYRLSKGLCIPASVVYNMDRDPTKALPGVVVFVMDQLIAYTNSGEFSLHENFSFELIDALVRIKEQFRHDH